MTDVVIIDALRTPIGALGGALAKVRPDDLAALVLKAIAERNKINVNEIDEVYFGCANQAGEDNRNVARMAPCWQASRLLCRGSPSTACAPRG